MCEQIEDQLARSRSAGCRSVSVKWQQLSARAPAPLQAPAHLRALFHGDRLLVYGFVPHCTQVRGTPRTPCPPPQSQNMPETRSPAGDGGGVHQGPPESRSTSPEWREDLVLKAADALWSRKASDKLLPPPRPLCVR